MSAPAIITCGGTIAGRWRKFIANLFPSVGGEVEVRIAPNAFGGFSIFAVNATARQILGGDEPTGNFGTYADARRRAVGCNCWTVVEERETRKNARTQA
jgi:hypothetical protein